MAVIDPYTRTYTEYELMDAETQRFIEAKIAEVTWVLDQNSITPALDGFPTGTVLSDAQTGSADSTNTFDYGNSGVASENVREAALVRIVTTIGLTPTCTYSIKGSMDNTTFTSLSVADSATPETFSASTFIITTEATTVKLVKPGQKYRYLKVVYSLNTNVTNTTDVYPLGD
jgi:hypothetical protein